MSDFTKNVSWVNQIFVQLTKLVCLHQPKFLGTSYYYLYKIFYWLNQIFWFNILYNFERAFYWNQSSDLIYLIRYFVERVGCMHARSWYPCVSADYILFHSTEKNFVVTTHQELRQKIFYVNVVTTNVEIMSNYNIGDLLAIAAANIYGNIV